MALSTSSIGLHRVQAFTSNLPRQRVTFANVGPRCTAVVPCSISCNASTDRRELLRSLAMLAAGLAVTSPPSATAADGKAICDAACKTSLEGATAASTPSGVTYKDIVVGTGPSPPVGYQIVVNYVAMLPDGKVFDSSLDRGKPYDIRVGAGQVIEGLDEGLRTMKVGGVRRIYIPGDLAFPKGLSAAAGRPRVPPKTPVVFDVQLLYIPGLDDE